MGEIIDNKSVLCKIVLIVSTLLIRDTLATPIISSQCKPISNELIASTAALSSTTSPQTIQTTQELGRITLYTGNDSTGISYKLIFKQRDVCLDLPGYMLNRVKSVDTNGSCVQLCEFKNCGGWCIKFQPGSPSHNRLRKLRFHNRAKSASPC